MIYHLRFLTALLVTGFVVSEFVFAFETCTPQNSYLEKLLPEVWDELPSPLPQNCVFASQASLAVNGYYGFCPSSVGQPARTHPRPCLSRKYVGAVHSALVAVADCFGYDPRLAFATFNLESATHLNAVGAAVDVGVGQLTRSAIDEVTLNALDKARKQAASSNNPSCRKILQYMTPHASDKEKRCGFMSVPDNPWRNLIYSILLIQQNRKAVDRYWTRLNIQLPANVDAERLKEHLTHLAYNAGAAGGVSTLAAYADIMGPRMSDRLFNFESKDLYSFPTFMGKNFPVPPGKESTRKRISKYVYYIAQAARRVEKLAGQQCFDPLTFPVPDVVPAVFTNPPDFSTARANVAEKITLLALDFQREQKLNRDCASKRAQFTNEFVPLGHTPKDLPKPLDEIYRQLCD